MPLPAVSFLPSKGRLLRIGYALLIIWTLLLGLSLLFNLTAIRNSTLHAAEVTGRASIDKDLIYRRWNSRHGGVYVPRSEIAQPNPYLTTPHRDLTTTEGLQLTMINPAYMTRQVFEMAEQQIGLHSHITSRKPINPGNAPDAWEEQALLRFERGASEVSASYRDAQGQWLRLMRPLPVEQACMGCHAHQGYQVGEVRGGISVKVPLEPFLSAEQQALRNTVIGHALIWFFGVLGIQGGVRRTRQQHQAEVVAEANRKEQAALQLVMDGVAESILLIDSNYIIQMANPAAIAFHGRDDLVGSCCHALIYKREIPCQHTRLEPCPLIEAREQSKPVVITQEHRRGDGELRIVELLSTPLWDDQGAFKGIIEVSRDVTARVQAERNLRHLAHHDPLTQLPNRLRFEDAFQQLLDDARGVTGLTLLFIDLDRFKNINDSLGHHIGDEVLRIIAERLRALTHGEHLLARFGGDEFTMLLIGQLTKPQIVALARRILGELERTITLESYEFFVNASLGIAIYPHDGSTVPALMKSADTALYRAKSLGRNTYQFYDKEGDQHALQRLQLEAALRTALADGSLRLFYQPQISAHNGRLVSVEALSRWHHPTLGPISPGEFIPIAEESGLIINLGQQVLRKACNQAACWHHQGYSIRVAVNVSAHQFLRADLCHDVARSLRDSGLPPHLLELEIVESALMEDVTSAAKTLYNLREMGISVAIDDFGTGYSSLNYLKLFPIHALKIDQSFVREVTNLRADKAVVKTIISLAKNLDLLVIAEGVENTAQRDYLIAKGCDLLQGYLFSKPVPAEQVDQLLAQQAAITE